MSRASFAESHAIDAGMSRAASRAGSISTLWSSAEVPFCLDPRTHSSFDTFDMRASRRCSMARTSSRYSSRSSQASIDFGRASIDIPDEYPRRPDTIRLTPPRPSISASSNTSSSSRVPSFNIGTIDENKPMQSSSPISHIAYEPPSLSAQHRILSSRFSEDTIDEPHIPHSSSQGTFGEHLSIPRSFSGTSGVSGTDSSRSSSMQTTGSSSQARTQAPAQAPSDLYRRAYRFFDKEYTVQPPASPSAKLSPSLDKSFDFGNDQRFDRPPMMGSDLSHESSLPSSSRSQTSTQASSIDSGSACSPEDNWSKSNGWAPVAVLSQQLTPGAHLTVEQEDSAMNAHDLRVASAKKLDSLSIPSLPSLPSLSSSRTATGADYAKDIRRRPSTADVYSQASQVSPHTFSNPSLPPSMPMPSPTDPVRYQVQSYAAPPALSPTSRTAGPDTSSKGGDRLPVSRALRSRVASTPKLRLDAASLFSSQQTLHLQHPVPPLPGRLSNPSTDRRPSTSQTDGREPFFGRRFRSRTLGEADHHEATSMQTAAADATLRATPLVVSPQRPLVLSSLSTAGSSSVLSQRQSSKISAISSDLPSPLYPMQPTPGSSICSASSPSTTLSSLPVTPRTTTTFPRPKSRGNSAASRSGSAGWASYLNSGLTLHLEGDHSRACQINMTYLAYDPFGRPEQLVEDTDDARAITPKRPKSRGDKDQEAEQSGTLEFGPSDERRLDACTFDLGRKSESSALLKHLTVGEETKADLLTRQAALSLKTLGNHQVSGYERKGRLAWKFAYRVEADGVVAERRRLVPIRFSCSATLLNPERAKKSRLLNLVKKQMVPTLASKVIANADNATQSPRSYAYSDGKATASPASSRNLQQQQQQQPDASSPTTRDNGNQNGKSSSASHSPMRQVGRTAASANSFTSADSSFFSQPTTPATPGRDVAGPDMSVSGTHLQASPVSAQFGQQGSGQRLPRSFATTGTAVGPALPTELGDLEKGPGKKLHEKVSMASLSVSTASSGSVQLAKPMMINGRKLIPVSLPAGLARKTRIDPALLQANVVPNVARVTEAGRQRSTSTHSSAGSSSDHSQRRHVPRQQVTVTSNGVTCLLSSQPRAGASTSRPPTASETIKLEYLARTASENSSPITRESTVAPQLRHQRSFADAVLTPMSFATAERQERRRRSKTNEDGRLRPFTADAWGEAQYPTREQQMRTISQQHRPPTGGQDQLTLAKIGAAERLMFQRGDRSAFVDELGVKPLPAPPRPNSRPRTAQTINAAAADTRRYHVPMRAIQGIQS